MSSDPYVTFRRVPASLTREPIESFAATLIERVAKRRDFHTLIVNDAELRRLNGQFRGKDYATDVLSFPAEAPPAELPAAFLPGLGDLAISYQRAAAQAREYGHSTEDEIRILMLHGLLHLLGMDHETDRGEMARRESSWRRKLDLPSTLIARATV